MGDGLRRGGSAFLSVRMPFVKSLQGLHLGTALGAVNIFPFNILHCFLALGANEINSLSIFHFKTNNKKKGTNEDESTAQWPSYL